MNAVDRMSELGDDMLLYILSLLPFREATRTKILSTPWLRLDTVKDDIVSLKCPFPLQQKEGMRNSYCYYQLGDETQFSIYMDWVNHTLDSYSYSGSEVIKKLSVHVPYAHQHNGVHNGEEEGNIMINKVLEFALSRETEIMDIRVVCSTKQVSFFEITYSFSTNKINGFLKELSITGVTDLFNRDISVLLSSLVALERLLLESCCCIEYLCIEGPPTSKLKHLTLSNVLTHRACISGLRNLVYCGVMGWNLALPYLSVLPDRFRFY